MSTMELPSGVFGAAGFGTPPDAIACQRRTTNTSRVPAVIAIRFSSRFPDSVTTTSRDALTSETCANSDVDTSCRTWQDPGAGILPSAFGEVA